VHKVDLVNTPEISLSAPIGLRPTAVPVVWPKWHRAHRRYVCRRSTRCETFI